MKQLAVFTCLLFSFCIARSQDPTIDTFMKRIANKGPVKYGSNKAAGKFYDVRGIKMYAETYGKGKPVLIIHGNGGSIDNFVNQIPYFAKQYKVIVADSRSQGASADAGDSLSYEMMADDYAELLNQMKIDSAYVIGWSDGGINALLLAIRHPEKVSKLAVTGANLWPDTTAVVSEVEDMVLPPYNAMKNKVSRTPKEQVQWKLLRLLIEEPHITLEQLHSIKVPALVIGGDHDVIKTEHTMLIAQNISNSYLWILPNSGHSTPIMYRDEFNKTVSDFFRLKYRTIAGESRFR